MLIQPVYLDTAALRGYVAALEGGELATRTDTGDRGWNARAGVRGPGVEAGGETKRSTASSSTFQDHDLARLQRLIDSAEAAAEQLGWADVVQPDVDMDGLGFGAMVRWECDTYVPEVVAGLRKQGGLADALDTLESMLPMAKALRLDTDGLPAADEVKGIRAFVESADLPPVVIGEESDADWRIVGTLNDKYVREGADLEGRFIVIGKVRKVIARGRWHPIMTLPGMNILGREERRKRERTAPQPSEENQYLAGPALVLDILAIYS